MNVGERLLSTEEAAEILNVSPKTLQKWRHKGEGPPFYRYGSGEAKVVGYAPTELRDWLKPQQQQGHRLYTTEVPGTTRRRSPSRQRSA
jgi:excisionase family DNA binding protein